MKKKKDNTGKTSKLIKKIRKRKHVLYFLMFIAYFVILLWSINVIDSSLEKKLDPQIARAIIQVSRFLPQLESNEKALRDAYRLMSENRERFAADDNIDLSRSYLSSDLRLDIMVNETISWMDRVKRMKVGRDGYAVVVSAKDDTILAHPDARYLGDKMNINNGVLFNDMKSVTIRIEDITSSTTEEDLDANYTMFTPQSTIPRGLVEYLDSTVYGSVLEYKDYYIVCGIPILEVIQDIIRPAFIVSLICLIGLWLLIKYICFVLDDHKEEKKTVLIKLSSYSVIVLVSVFLLSWYLLVLTDVTNDLKTMERHAGVAVDTLEVYEEHKDKINAWLDEQYLLQCRLAADVISSMGKKDLTREEIRALAGKLGVKHIYVFDKKGKVLVTNSSFDHFVLSDDPDDQSYAFRILLDGADHVIQQPMENDVIGEPMQYIGVGLRDENDLCDGFVQIGVSPLLRNSITSQLDIRNVLANLVIGLPDHALAVDKETLEIVATTGIGFEGQSIEDMGISADDLKKNFNGFLRINGKTYYAGVSESEDLYLVPIVRQTGKLSAFTAAGRIMLVMILILSVTVLTAYLFYRRIFSEALDTVQPEEDLPKNVPSDNLNVFESLVKKQDKEGFDARWKYDYVPKNEQTPEMKMHDIIYYLLLVLCVLILIPQVYYKLYGDQDNDILSGLAYVISGNWEKGVNIFAFSSCVFLMCTMYVFVVLINRILYQIARISDTRIETVCHLLRSSIKYICAVVFIYYGLAQFGVDTKTLLASAGILSLIIGLGAKDLVNDIIAGFFMIFEGTCKVGDYIKADGFEGTVQEVGIRTTRVRCFTDTKIFNNSSIRDIISSDNNSVRMAVRVPVAYDADILEIEEIFREEFPKLMDVIPGLMREPVIEGVVDYLDSSIILRVAIYVKPEVRFPAHREFMKQIKLILDRHGIEIPFTQIVIHQTEKKYE